MARQVFLSASTGWDERTNAPLCSVTLYYDDVTLIMAEAEVINTSDDTVATFAIEDTTKAAKDPTRKQSQDVSAKVPPVALWAITAVQLKRVAGETKGDPDRIVAPEGWVFAFNGPAARRDATKDTASKAMAES